MTRRVYLLSSQSAGLDPQPVPEDALRLGIVFADGRRVATTGGSPPHAREPGRLVLQMGGGGGDELSNKTDFWVHPLPPAGPVTMVVSWLAHGITEARAEVEGTAIREAAQRAITLWPEEPEPESGASWTTSAIIAESPD